MLALSSCVAGGLHRSVSSYCVILCPALSIATLIATLIASLLVNFFRALLITMCSLVMTQWTSVWAGTVGPVCVGGYGSFHAYNVRT